MMPSAVICQWQAPLEIICINDIYRAVTFLSPVNVFDKCVIVIENSVLVLDLKDGFVSFA